MPNEIEAALVGLIGTIIGVVPTYLFMHKRGVAEIEKLKAETDKTKAEAEKIRREMQSVKSGNRANVVDGVDSLVLQKEAERLKELLLHIYNLHKTRYRLGYRKISYIIDRQGGVYTKEEVLIIPLDSGKVHFREIGLGISSNSKEEVIVQNLRAVNKLTNHKLETIELSKDRRRHLYAIVLDPPATIEAPVELVIESYRPSIFLPLITQLRDQGSLKINSVDNDTAIEMKIVAPPQIKFTSFSMSPNIGIYTLEKFQNLSSIVWKGENLMAGVYTYTIQAQIQN